MSLYQPFLEEISQELLDWSNATAVQLPTDYPRSKHRMKGMRNHELLLPTHTIRKIRDIAGGEQVSLDLAVLAVFHMLLMRYSGQDEYVTETKLAGSASVLTLVRCEENPSFQEWLSRVKKLVMASVEIGEETQKWESLRAVQFANYLDNHEESTEFLNPELKLSVYPKETSWYACFSYDPSLFCDETIQRMGEHLVCLLEEVVKAPERPIRSYSILTQREADLFEIWNRTQLSVPEKMSVDQWIASFAKQNPEALAVKDSSQSLTYGELERRANQLAHYLQERGVKPGDLVAICLGRSCDAIISLLAVFKVGAAYVPIDPAYPAERITYMLHDSQASLVITDTQWSQKLMLPVDQVIYVDLERTTIASMSATSISQISSLDQLSYVIYTSGSTGQPKGVMISHRSLLNLIFWHLMYSR
jgi:non-ribosomal peptide synthetase component F